MNSSSADSLLTRLEDALREALREWGGRPVFIGLSGGMDSMLLLECLAAMSDIAPRLTAIHVHHGLNADADEWQALCERRCDALNIPLIKERVQVQTSGKGVEAAARDARYSAFEQRLPTDAVLLTAHHASDQAETLLLRLFRGSGLKGLRGIPSQRLLSGRDSGNTDKRVILRPWLDFRRADLFLAAETLGVDWAEDSSNDDESFDRNWLRHSQIPELTARYPSLEKTLVRTARHLADDYLLLQTLLQPVYDAAMTECQWASTGKYCLSVAELARQPSRVRFHLLSYWLEQNQVDVPETGSLMHWLNQCLTAAPDRQPLLLSGEFRLQRHRQHLYVWSEQSTPDTVNEVPATWGRGSIRLRDDETASMPVIPPHYELRPAKLCTDVRLRPEGRPAQRLKNIWQETGVPPWLREHWPVLLRSGEPVALLGLMNDRSVKCELVDILRLEWL